MEEQMKKLYKLNKEIQVMRMQLNTTYGMKVEDPENKSKYNNLLLEYNKKLKQYKELKKKIDLSK